jgi:putative Mg2+ transporter-C (MgtC) family protein
MNGYVVIGRLFLSALFGALVGIERQWRHKNAGLKTNALVSIGATAFGLIALHGFGSGSQPTQIAAGVVTGVGFIGAGVIMHRGASLQGINSAATLWAAAGMGLALGQGFYSLGISLLVIVLITQFSLQRATEYINERSGLKTPSVRYQLSFSFKPESAKAVRSIWSQFVEQSGIAIISYHESREQDTNKLEATISLPQDNGTLLSDVYQEIGAVPGVLSTDCKLTVLPEQELS